MTQTESAAWCQGHWVQLDDSGRPARPASGPCLLRCAFPKAFPQLLTFSKSIESALQPRDACLLWVTDFGIFPSSENLHLYERLRHSYGELRLLEEAPGHLCQNYERADAVTIIYLSMLFGWDLHVLPSGGYGRAFVSHDEWVSLELQDSRQREETRSALVGMGMTPAE